MATKIDLCCFSSKKGRPTNEMWTKSESYSITEICFMKQTSFFKWNVPARSKTKKKKLSWILKTLIWTLESSFI